MDAQYFVYILTNRHHTTWYAGVTNNLVRRACEHKHKPADGLTKRYNIDELVYFEIADSIEAAIARENPGSP